MRVPVDQWNRADADLPGSYQLSLSLRVSAWYFFPSERSERSRDRATGKERQQGDGFEVEAHLLLVSGTMDRRRETEGQGFQKEIGR